MPSPRTDLDSVRGLNDAARELLDALDHKTHHVLDAMAHLRGHLLTDGWFRAEASAVPAPSAEIDVALVAMILRDHEYAGMRRRNSRAEWHCRFCDAWYLPAAFAQHQAEWVARLAESSDGEAGS